MLKAVKEAVGIDTDPGPEPEPVETMDMDEVMECIQYRRRRLIIEHLAHHDGVLSHRELSEAIAYIETDAPSMDEIDRTDYKRVYIAIYQSHLPKLNRLGVVEWEKDTGVRPTRACKQLALIIDQLRRLAGGEIDD